MIVAIVFNLNRRHEIRRIVRRLASAAAVMRLILQRRVAHDRVGYARMIGRQSVSVLVQAETAESRRVIKR